MEFQKNIIYKFEALSCELWLFIKNNLRFLLILCNWILVRIHGLSNDLAPHPVFRTSWGTTTSSRRNPSKNWFNKITDSCITTTIRRVRQIFLTILMILKKTYFSQYESLLQWHSNYERKMTLIIMYYGAYHGCGQAYLGLIW